MTGHPNLSSEFDCLPNGAPIPGNSHSSPSNSPERPSSVTEPSRRSRSRSPINYSSLRVLGFSFEELKSVRLIPKANPNRRFEIRRYTFPRDKPICVRGEYQLLRPIPKEEKLKEKRVKINIYSGAVEEMSREEIRETPLTRKQPVSKNFETIILKNDDSNN
ncbi:uncharacterized protein LOC117178490 [Belonocnema kinseyi]|uniref:uncharacterized protein LOC117178490 n=1 Tax=Belonocnema kinseyi TaxID=2817044 RepID=UPI00143D5F1B|nr:uncharacterized protein LOC117178490 [Belonocnema kinseyi]